MRFKKFQDYCLAQDNLYTEFKIEFFEARFTKQFMKVLRNENFDSEFDKDEE